MFLGDRNTENTRRVRCGIPTGADTVCLFQVYDNKRRIFHLELMTCPHCIKPMKIKRQNQHFITWICECGYVATTDPEGRERPDWQFIDSIRRNNAYGGKHLMSDFL